MKKWTLNDYDDKEVKNTHTGQFVISLSKYGTGKTSKSKQLSALASNKQNTVSYFTVFLFSYFKVICID